MEWYHVAFKVMNRGQVGSGDGFFNAQRAPADLSVAEILRFRETFRRNQGLPSTGCAIVLVQVTHLPAHSGQSVGQFQAAYDNAMEASA